MDQNLKAFSLSIFSLNFTSKWNHFVQDWTWQKQQKRAQILSEEQIECQIMMMRMNDFPLINSSLINCYRH